MQKIVINRCFGGFGLSEEAIELLMKKDPMLKIRTEVEKNRLSEVIGYDPETYDKIHKDEEAYQRFWSDEYMSDRDIPRDLQALIEVVEELGPKANGSYAELAIVEIPDDVKWQIEEYDGSEWIAEQHRTWR